MCRGGGEVKKRYIYFPRGGHSISEQPRRNTRGCRWRLSRGVDHGQNRRKKKYVLSLSGAPGGGWMSTKETKGSGSGPSVGVMGNGGPGHAFRRSWKSLEQSQKGDLCLSAENDAAFGRSPKARRPAGKQGKGDNPLVRKTIRGQWGTSRTLVANPLSSRTEDWAKREKERRGTFRPEGLVYGGRPTKIATSAEGMPKSIARL